LNAFKQILIPHIHTLLLKRTLQIPVGAQRFKAVNVCCLLSHTQLTKLRTQGAQTEALLDTCGALCFQTLLPSLVSRL
jgi:hypothetical protein